MAEAACTPTVVITSEEAVATSVAVSGSPASPVTATRRRGRNVHLKQGYLVKKGHVRRNWRTRWFVLRRSTMDYYCSREDKSARGSIPLVGASLSCLSPNESHFRRPWVLKITTIDGRDYLIEASDQATREEWRAAIEERIRLLDPSKLRLKKPLTLTRSIGGRGSNEADLAKERDIVVAMQDCSAGVTLQELPRKKGSKRIVRYFTGKDGIDWLLSWFFASTRIEAIQLATSMLRNGFFHALDDSEDQRLSKSVIAMDRDKYTSFLDSETAKYIFVVFAPTSTDLFPESDDDGWLSDIQDGRSPSIVRRRGSVDSTDSSPDEDSTAAGTVKSGFLLKKGHVRRNWKARLFVLKEKAMHLCYYRGSKNHKKPQGSIPLQGLTISVLNKDSFVQSTSSSSSAASPSTSPLKRSPKSPSFSSFRPNAFSLQTPTGLVYLIQATNSEERESWVSAIRQAVHRIDQRTKAIENST